MDKYVLRYRWALVAALIIAGAAIAGLINQTRALHTARGVIRSYSASRDVHVKELTQLRTRPDETLVPSYTMSAAGGTLRLLCSTRSASSSGGSQDWYLVDQGGQLLYLQATDLTAPAPPTQDCQPTS